MIEKRKVCVITGTRAEYGLLYWLMKEINVQNDLCLQLVVTGMHLSPDFGNTYKQIEDDGFVIDHKVEMLLSSDTSVGITKSMGIAMIGFADAFENLNPDLVVVLGDRYEIFSAVSAAMIARIPVAHIHGGETTVGAYDEAMRHSITKMSHLHFTAAEEYRNRVIQMGEEPSRVFNVGSLGVENIKRFKLLNLKEFEESIDFKLGKYNLMVTFHPVTLENNSSEFQFSNLIAALDKLDDTNIIFTKANADTDGRVINRMIDDYVHNHKDNSIAFDSLGQLRYFSAMQYIDGVVGNSSSGLIEVPTFKVGTINIGDRQSGRIKAKSVIDCNPVKNEILNAINILLSKSFKKSIELVTNPYGDGKVVDQIIKIILNTKLDDILKKDFYDIGLKH
jgi:GDP/UDP-N,N'-diacetylbacillosamine 2-epimerase (hydrolysing)